MSRKSVVNKWYLRNKEKHLLEKRKNYKEGKRQGQNLTQEQRDAVKIGDVFEGIKILEVGENHRHQKTVTYKCECGKEKKGCVLLNLPFRCIACENKKKNKIHGLSNTKEYDSWRYVMKISRTPLSKLTRGDILVFEPWADFLKFFEDVGLAPTPTCKFVRIDKSGNFEPGNVEWRELKVKRFGQI